MKKIFLVSFALVSLVAANAQTNKNSAASKAPVGEPLVNGIPYSQYKAQQDALKQTNPVTPSAKVQVPPVPTAVTETKQPVITTAKPVTQTQISSAPVKIVTTADIKADRSTPVPTVSTPVKAEVVTDKATPAQVVARPTVNLATNTDVQSAAVSTPVNTGVKVEQSKVVAAPVEEIKPSTTVPAPKVPVVPMQKTKE